MRTRFLGGSLAALMAVLVLAAGAWADEKEEKVPLDKVPKAVLDAVKAKYPGAELTGAEKESENGKVVYEVALKFKGQKIEATFTPEGTLVSVERVIDAKDLPKPVSEALDAKYPKATIKLAEEETKDGKVTYEVLLVTQDKKTVEVVLDAQGKVLKEEKKEEKKGEKEGK
jgi:uncharacterized membrane protein YkoI